MDPAAGLPRQAVPVRFACRAADWSPALLAELVSEHGYPTVHEFDPVTGRVADVHAAAYGSLGKLDAPLPEALALLPANHFVWSDDLVFAFSHWVDDSIGRESASEQRLGIRWNPALSDCTAVVAASVDLSALNAPTKYRVSVDGGLRTFEFDGKSATLIDSVGLAYISHLLFHPDKPIAPINLMYCARDPQQASGDEILSSGESAEVSEIDQPATQASADEIRTAGEEELPQIDQPATQASGDENRTAGGEAELSQIDRPAPSENTEDEVPELYQSRSWVVSGDPVFDDNSIESIKTGLAKLLERKKAAEARGDFKKASQLQDEHDRAQQIFRAGRNKTGQARRLGSDQERARKQVTNAINRAKRELAKRHPPLAAHIERYLETGGQCIYRPSPSIRWSS